MTDHRTARIEGASYENVTVTCPWCGRVCVFNRRSDLETLNPIAGREVTCLHPDCRQSLWIMGDRVNGAHETLLFDCYELLAHKHFMNCVLTAAQAYELFFSLFFRVELVYRPFAAGRTHDIDGLNRVHRTLLNATKTFTFAPMRRLFLRCVVDGRAPGSLEEAEVLASRLKPPRKAPEESEINGLRNELVEPLLGLGRTGVGDLRNMVVHKEGYRPSADEARGCVEEARGILFPLTYLLDLHDDVNAYTMRTPVD